MRQAAWMAGASVLSWLVTTAFVGTQTGLDVLLGMIGPLVVASGAWVLTERTHRRNPGRATSFLVGAFAAKMVFFGAYMAIGLGALALHPVPFVVSFTSYFIALQVAEAICLRRLIAGDK